MLVIVYSPLVIVLGGIFIVWFILALVPLYKKTKKKFIELIEQINKKEEENDKD